MLLLFISFLFFLSPARSIYFFPLFSFLVRFSRGLSDPRKYPCWFRGSTTVISLPWLLRNPNPATASIKHQMVPESSQQFRWDEIPMGPNHPWKYLQASSNRPLNNWAPRWQQHQLQARNHFRCLQLLRRRQYLPSYQLTSKHDEWVYQRTQWPTASTTRSLICHVPLSTCLILFPSSRTENHRREFSSWSKRQVFLWV